MARLRVTSLDFAEASKHMSKGSGSGVAKFDSVLGPFMMLDHVLMQARRDLAVTSP